MKVHRHSEHQRRLWVHEMVHKTRTIKAICAEAEISRATLYNWQNELKERDAKAKEEQSQASSLPWQPNDKYKMLLSALLKTDIDKTVSRRLVKELVKRYNLTTAQACALTGMPEEDYHHRPRKPQADDKEVYAALVHLLEENKSRSLEDCIAILQRMQPHWAIKQIKRVYRQGRLYLKRVRVRRLPEAQEPVVHVKVDAPLRLHREGAFWHFGVMQYPGTSSEKNWLLYLLDYNDGTPLNALTGMGTITEEDVMQLVYTSVTDNGLPKKIRIPAMAPFTNRHVPQWCREHKVPVYNLSMVKPENALEAQYITSDIIKQLELPEAATYAELQMAADEWIQSFARNSRQAGAYFVREPVV